MGKLKTRESAEKRFKMTSSGKLLRGHAYSSHLKTKKRNSRVRRQHEPTEVSPADKTRLVRLLPYG
ncbi:MAG: 50S ribosomal protein L35 [Candidatus Woykebacteria bacterium RIFCSPHIGHO2_12_FULL_43_10]|uniref:Large ribosomal subunit protein bL35 n=2 Tax=Candidatus Woykeibacteriota TaxID=1817899 RepID=A0A1G1WWV2_9BACT|nr:MAG: 50S ribosomal protein L35 [Candidatus Woykebacteria bacterium RIFCSPHIGHO2_02_FULL_43_16b]OGY28652.1 MAG: 50S ribosomal protein L35 [Candidatus Woykebacteria bacterium RIFCSPHIGHO2_01_FULL_43_29]OGY28785.1 MAG: 50S ribosomal protein L35 [Candidatus Woykebacteria bacterium RIFCSPHIGHO2_12_FULL_43_10]OGY32193.1 MAG: 50S ribosomal protein L35 [Candidatus Woykebacteria bacterium RIFCSPLOWO2_01_FULL_43_14]